MRNRPKFNEICFQVCLVLLFFFFCFLILRLILTNRTSRKAIWSSDRHEISLEMPQLGRIQVELIWGCANHILFRFLIRIADDHTCKMHSLRKLFFITPFFRISVVLCQKRINPGNFLKMSVLNANRPINSKTFIFISIEIGSIWLIRFNECIFNRKKICQKEKVKLSTVITISNHFDLNLIGWYAIVVMLHFITKYWKGN